MTKRPYLTLTILILALLAIAVQFAPSLIQKAEITHLRRLIVAHKATPARSNRLAPMSIPNGGKRKSSMVWRLPKRPACEPDNPYDIAASVKGTNNVSMATLMQSNLSQDALVMGEDVDKDGDPDVIHLKLEVVEFNGNSPDGDYFITRITLRRASNRGCGRLRRNTAGWR